MNAARRPEGRGAREPTRPPAHFPFVGAAVRRGMERDVLGTVTAWTWIFLGIACGSAFFAASDPAGVTVPATILAWVFGVLAALSVLPGLAHRLRAGPPDGRRNGRAGG